MANYRIGVIGSGNMARAIIAGMIQKGIVQSDSIIVSDISDKALQSVKEAYRVNTTTDNCEVAKNSDMIILAVKPNICADVLDEIHACLSEDSAVVSIVTGWESEQLQIHLQEGAKVLRVMPNTPMTVGEGMTAFSLDHDLTDAQLALAVEIFSALGRVEMVQEQWMDAVTAISGSGPAYGFVIIEAMADAGVREGLPRDLAYTLAAQTLLGSAKMVLETHEHPGKLKDMVTTPNGTTIAALYELEKSGIRNAFYEAIHAAAERSETISKANEPKVDPLNIEPLFVHIQEDDF